MRGHFLPIFYGENDSDNFQWLKLSLKKSLVQLLCTIQYANESLGDDIRDAFAQMRKDQEKFLDRLDRRERDRREGRVRKSSRKSYGRGRDPDLSSDSDDSYSRGGRY